MNKIDMIKQGIWEMNKQILCFIALLITSSVVAEENIINKTEQKDDLYEILPTLEAFSKVIELIEKSND